MPLDSNLTLHRWTKEQSDRRKRNSLPAEPEVHDLLGFKGVPAEHCKVYIRKLWLAAEKFQGHSATFIANNAAILQKRIAEVVSILLNDEDKLHEALNEDNFLDDEVRYILIYDNFGPHIWGPDNGAPDLLFSKHGTKKPTWADDQDSIILCVRQWMAARLQARINIIEKGRQSRRPIPVEETMLESVVEEDEEMEQDEGMEQDEKPMETVETPSRPPSAEPSAVETLPTTPQPDSVLCLSSTTPGLENSRSPSTHTTVTGTGNDYEPSCLQVDSVLGSYHGPQAGIGNDEDANHDLEEDEVRSEVSDSVLGKRPATGVFRRRKSPSVRIASSSLRPPRSPSNVRMTNSSLRPRRSPSNVRPSVRIPNSSLRPPRSPSNVRIANSSLRHEHMPEASPTPEQDDGPSDEMVWSPNFQSHNSPIVRNVRSPLRNETMLESSPILQPHAGPSDQAFASPNFPELNPSSVPITYSPLRHEPRRETSPLPDCYMLEPSDPGSPSRSIRSESVHLIDPDAGAPFTDSQLLFQRLDEILTRTSPYSVILERIAPLALKLYADHPYHQFPSDEQRMFADCGHALHCWFALIRGLSDTTDTSQGNRVADVDSLPSTWEKLNARREKMDMRAWKKKRLEAIVAVSPTNVASLSEDLSIILQALIDPLQDPNWGFPGTLLMRLRGFNRDLLETYGVFEVYPVVEA
ncbi:hypothetical protein FB567DRAFT_630781 [Paraphoma chrysanthemicola]|uniref:Uncharacterized protein n=1 Tax=Paraphoma chrysanthemicola TaxID=798071 RepID=A0A8K0R172_9PLEO|nr:hypothetical protein FB567DRAFT_630781 [Paraphoma chrysanthemicola]